MSGGVYDCSERLSAKGYRDDSKGSVYLLALWWRDDALEDMASVLWSYL